MFSLGTMRKFTEPQITCVLSNMGIRRKYISKCVRCSKSIIHGEKFMTLNIYFRKEQISKIKYLSFHQRKPDKDQIKSKASIRK